MNINRHNYEEFFILYMDNELNDAEKQMVEAFAQNNPDLKDELDILLQSKLTPDNTIVFEGKEELMKMADGTFINLSNYEEWLTLYIDNELNPEQKHQVDQFIAAHPQLQSELSLLQKTKLEPEEIIFPYKESLYRKTEKVRIVQMKWWRVAAAAILLLAIGTIVVLVSTKKKQSERNIVKTPINTPIKSNTNNTPTTNPEIKKEIKQDEIKENKANESKLANTQIRKENKSPEKKIEKKSDEQPVIANNDNNKPSNNLPQPSENSYLKNGPVETEIANNTSHIGKTISPTNNVPVTKELQKTSDDGLTFAKESKESIKDPELEEGQNKSSRGFFRKAVRFFEKTTGIKASNEDDKVLIGGLAVKLK